MTRVVLTEEQTMLATTTAKMVADHSILDNSAVDNERAIAGLWAALVANGLIGLAVPEKHGGIGGTIFDVALVVEQFARGLSGVPYLGTVLALDLLEAATPGGTEAAALLSGRPGCVVLETSLVDVSASGIAVDVAPDSLAIGVDGDVVCLPRLGDRLESADLSRALARAGRGSDHLGALPPGSSLRWQALALPWSALISLERPRRHWMQPSHTRARASNSAAQWALFRRCNNSVRTSSSEWRAAAQSPGKLHGPSTSSTRSRRCPRRELQRRTALRWGGQYVRPRSKCGADWG